MGRNLPTILYCYTLIDESIISQTYTSNTAAAENIQSTLHSRQRYFQSHTHNCELFPPFDSQPQICRDISTTRYSAYSLDIQRTIKACFSLHNIKHSTSNIQQNPIKIRENTKILLFQKQTVSIQNEEVNDGRVSAYAK